jgi:hypothetical protein
LSSPAAFGKVYEADEAGREIVTVRTPFTTVEERTLRLDPAPTGGRRSPIVSYPRSHSVTVPAPSTAIVYLCTPDYARRRRRY